MTKTISIRDQDYKSLIAVKRDNESFSELLERLMKHQTPSEILKSLRGTWELSREEKREFFADVNSRW